MSDKTWGRTETGSTFHNFRPDGTAVCRKNLRVGRNLGGRTRELAETHAASMHGRVAGRTMCATCVKKDDEYNARVEASMAPVNAYDQVCEGVVTDEGAAKAAESDEHTDVDTLHGEAIAEVEMSGIKVGDVYQAKRGGGLRATVREVRCDADDVVVIFTLSDLAYAPSPSRFRLHLNLEDFQNVYDQAPAETDTAAPTVRDALRVLRARRAEMTGYGPEPDWAQAFGVLESEGLFAQYDN